MMDYNNIYDEFKNRVTECLPFVEQKENELMLDGDDGAHVLFGSAIEPFIYDAMKGEDIAVLKKVADFVEEMETHEDIQVAEVFEQSILEGLIGKDRQLLAKYDNLWGPETKEAIKEVGQFIL